MATRHVARRIQELEGKYYEEYSGNEEVLDVKEDFEEEYGDN